MTYIKIMAKFRLNIPTYLVSLPAVQRMNQRKGKKLFWKICKKMFWKI